MIVRTTVGDILSAAGKRWSPTGLMQALSTAAGFNGDIMKRMFAYCTITLLLLASGIFAEEKAGTLALKDLPPAAQKSAQDFGKGAKLMGVTKGEENGKTVYKVETYLHGLSRDVLIDAAGEIIEIEETSTLNKTPGNAKAAIEKAAAGGKITKVNTVTRNGVTTYKAVIKKEGKNIEIRASVEGLIIK
jgi:hypothetical protein